MKRNGLLSVNTAASRNITVKCVGFRGYVPAGTATKGSMNVSGMKFIVGKIWTESVQRWTSIRSRKGSAMKFNASKFRKNADSVCRKLIPEPHRLALDGKEVVNGKIDYSVDGKDYYLYPVLKEWCD